jgi:outer membrane lipoprotein SlyB
MRTRVIALAMMTALGLAGCAEYGGYRPAVDTYNDPNAANVSRDQADCREVARQASGGTAAQAATGGVVGGLLGGAAGAAIGAASGNRAGTGAAIGAAAAGLGGGVYKGIEADQNFKDAYRTCMRNRGHTVVN